MATTNSTTEERTELVQRVWKECWTEFHLWREEYCRKELATLPSFTQVKDEIDAGAEPPGPAFEDLDADMEVEEEEDMETMTIWQFDSNRTPSQGVSTTTLSVPTYRDDPIEDSTKPVPPYESCVPLSKGITLTNTAVELGVLEFHPFANEPQFAKKNPDFLYEGKEDGAPLRWEYAWKMGGQNPDVNTIICEAVRRLHFDHGMTMDHIDTTNILPVNLVLENGRIWNPARTQALLPWPPELPGDPRPTFQDLVPRPPAATSALRTVRMARLMCMDLSCVQPACTVHGLGPQPIPLPNPPHLQDLEEVNEPCGTNCYRVRGHGIQVPLWSQDEIEELESVRTVFSEGEELEMCSLATMVDKPCWEVYVQLHKLSGDFDFRLSLTPENEAVAAMKPKPKKRAFVGHSEYLKYNYARPCEHAGSCDENEQCICFKQQLRCKRNCQCDSNCGRRYKGCPCSGKQDAPCSTKTCLCRKYSRECDPELCKKCGAKAGAPCKNVPMVHGQRKNLTVIMKDYPWGPGWGVAIAEAADEGDFIAEYVGETVGETASNERYIHSAYLKRNYLFGLDKGRTIDSAAASNETRFINHPLEGTEPNCEAAVRFVNSEPRIAIYAKRHIEAQEELFFSYGEDFFIADTSEDDESQKESDDGQTAARVRGVVKAPLPTTW